MPQVLSSNKKYKIRMGEPPRKRAEPLFYDDTHRAIHESWRERHPEVFETHVHRLVLTRLLFPSHE